MTRLTSLIAKSLLMLLVVSGILATNLQAQSSAFTVSVSFPFTVDTQTLAPGTYQFSLDFDSFLLSVFDVKTSHEKLFLVRPALQPAVEQRGRLVFRNSEGYRALNEVHLPGSEMFLEVVQGHRAERIEAQRSSPGNPISAPRR
jgi:hypothetical protein